MRLSNNFGVESHIKKPSLQENIKFHNSNLAYQENSYGKESLIVVTPRWMSEHGGNTMAH